MKIRPVGAVLFRATDRRTEKTKFLVTLRNSANAPEVNECYNIIAFMANLSPAAIKPTLVFMYSSRHFCQILNYVCSISEDFNESPQYKITRNASSGSRADTC
jgi:hypothetical protein